MDFLLLAQWSLVISLLLYEPLEHSFQSQYALIDIRALSHHFLIGYIGRLQLLAPRQVSHTQLRHFNREVIHVSLLQRQHKDGV